MANKYLSGPKMSDEEKMRHEKNAFWILIGTFVLFVAMTVFMWWVRTKWL
jgi:hypothetical protein